MSAPRDDTPWQDPAARPEAEDLLAPRTQIVSDRDAYLGQGRYDVGRRIADDQVELFASTDAASALRLEFEQHQPWYVAVHDIGTSAALRLLNSLANASGGRLQRLTVRRQGHGVALAVLQFIEIRIADGTPVRVYATDLGDDHLQTAMARVLLSHSSLGVLLMGAIGAEATARQLQPLNEAVQQGRWPNRELLMVPLGSGVALAAHAAQLAGHSSVAVHVTPRATKTRQAWTYIAGAWNRLHGHLGGEHSMPTEFEAPGGVPPAPPVPRSEAPTEPMGLHAVSTPAAPTATVDPWQVYVDNCALLKGALACCVFDSLSHQPLAHAGTPGTAALLAEQGAKLLRSMTEATRALGFGTAPADGTVSTTDHHLIVRPVAGHPGAAVHLVLAATTNLTLAKLQLERVTPPR